MPDDDQAVDERNKAEFPAHHGQLFEYLWSFSTPPFVAFVRASPFSPTHRARLDDTCLELSASTSTATWMY